MSFDPEGTQQSSRARLMDAGKSLFARHGFEQTSTAMIAREAGTSESQLVRYFKSKAGLLEAIFNTSWTPLNQGIQSIIAESTTAREALLSVVEAMMSTFEHDHELAFLLIFEGRRVRGGSDEVNLSQGFVHFSDLLCKLILRGKRDGTFTESANENALAFALMGAAEGMLRERIIAERAGREASFGLEHIRTTFVSLVRGVTRQPTSTTSKEN